MFERLKMTTNNLDDLRTQIIHRVSLLLLIYLTPIYFLAIYRIFYFGFQPLFFFHTLLFAGIIGLWFFKNSFSLNTKIFGISFVLISIGLLGLLNFGLSGGHYFLLAGVAIMAILSRSQLFYYSIVFALLTYFTIGILIVLKVIEPQLSIVLALSSPIHWFIHLFSILFLSIIFIYVFGNYYARLVKTIDDKEEAEQDLKQLNSELEDKVKERTEKLEKANKKLQSTNEVLNQKSKKINNQNDKLLATLKHLKETQSQLLHSEKMASLGILTAGVAHEINNPLNYIMGAYEGLKIQQEKSTSSLEDKNISLLLKALKTGVDNASDIVNSLNQFSRDSNKMNEECDLHEIVDNSLVMIQHKLKNRVEVHKDFCSTPIIIKGNVGNMHQMFLNILSNAEDAIVGKGKISVRTQLSDDTISIEISDTGSGIKKEHLKKVIDPFFTTKAPGKGTGLGLSIAYNILTEHGGVLEFESHQKQGTTAKIIFHQK